MPTDGPSRVTPSRNRPATRAIRAGCLAAALLLTGPVAAPAAAGNAPATGHNPWTMCAKATNRIERQEGIPRQLLRAISKAESGRLHRDKQIVMAWPWTVMAEGRGRYLETKAQAIAEVETLRARGVKNIDVGCMQINLGYHGEAFASLEEAFDPVTNVAYGGRFLRQLHAQTRTWAAATGRYHNADRDLGQSYRARVYRLWWDLRRRQGQAPEIAEASFIEERQRRLVGETATRQSGKLPTARLINPLSRTGGTARILRGQ